MTNLQTIESRFLAPENWFANSFTTSDGYKIHYGGVLPDEQPKVIVVGLQGLSEFTEKYFETASFFMRNQIGFFMMDWLGQGRSARYLPNRHKRHSRGFNHDVNDFHVFVSKHVKPAIQKKYNCEIPLAMLGHSMGGHLGLAYLASHPDNFANACFSAPMLGMQALNVYPAAIHAPLTFILNTVAGQSYVFDGSDWSAGMREGPGENIFSSDPIRDTIHNYWCMHDPELQVGAVTFGWLYEAVKSCRKLKDKGVLSKIRIPTVFAVAGKDALVENEAIRYSAKNIKDAHLLELPNARHEILMERDEIRDRFLSAFMDQLT